MHEAHMHPQNCFITLTYNNENLPSDGSLHYEHFRDFFKRLRKKYGAEIRYYHCGEYGEKFARPHYHAIIFNFDFPDKILFRVDPRGTKLYRSPSLENLWKFGFSTIGAVTFETAAYVARYVTKKLTGSKPFLYRSLDEKGLLTETHYDNSDEHYQVINYETGEITYRKREYATMSRRPGIGKTYLEKYKGDIYPLDLVQMRGKSFKPPRYYDAFLESHDPDLFKNIKIRRNKNAKKITGERLEAMEKCKISKTKTLYRKYENPTILNT